MKHNIRPADEEMGNAVPLLAFSILWYAAVARQMAGAFQPSLVLFAAAGVLPLYSAVQMIRRAQFYRAQRAQAVAGGHPAHGTITGVAQKMVPYSGKHGRLRFQKYYYLQVDVRDPMTGAVYSIESQAYRKPIHRCLASPQVLVYTDDSGFRHYLEEFQWKTSKTEPDIFSYPREFEDTQQLPIGQIAFVVIAILMLFQLFL